ncbi:MAG: ABC transporter permease [Anaerolineaceae bacterium]|nr:ABC transporter permease [Anaerolineaceae bacterium]
MRFFDLISLILENLSRRKGRVALTAIGVVIGTASVVILVSLAVGLQRNATKQLGGIGDLTQIQVNPTYGMPEGGKGGGGPVSIRIAGGKGGNGPGQPTVTKLLTPQSISELEAIPGVVAAIPRDYLQSSNMIQFGKLEAYGNIMGVGTNDLSVFEYKLQSGSLKLEKGTAIIGAAMIRNFNDPRMRPGQEPPPPPDLQDQTVRLTLSKWVQDGQSGYEVKKSYPVRIVGVIAESRSEADYTMYMTLDDLTTYNEWAQGRRINRNRDGYNMVSVKVSDVDKVLDIADQITKMGFQANTPQSFVQGVNSFFVVLQVIFGGVGAVALLVAAIGIANTMAMAILERTREIGLMKAVGATNNNVLSVFLGEAAGIGFIGGLGGVALGWGAGKVLDVVAMSYFASQASQGGMPTTLAVYTPVWLPAFALVFATLVGLLSGLYPALRAATLIPVNALKYE